jgi:hypothetical protein
MSKQIYTFRMPSESISQLQQEALVQGKKPSALLRDLVQEWLKNREKISA